MERYVCVHGHFYQPPREHPWLAAIAQQDSAYPYHDWNERITAECYAPNTAARILDSTEHIVRIVNNYAGMSFNFGPTLLAWLEQHAADVYTAIVEADRVSQGRFAGHGSALAQAYNHMILPLANARDAATQIRWGIEDFVQRFRRQPEGMWLPETAVDLATLDLLAAADIRFTILAPSQAGRVRPLGGGAWQSVTADELDTTRAYVQRLPSGRQITLFFYHAVLARQVAFERLLHNGQQFAERLVGAFRPDTPEAQLVHLATDGETYGHHHQFGEMALAYALHHIDSQGLARLTNYGAFLAAHPPRHEVDIRERTSWSCAHGIERWRSNCGCRTGGAAAWQQHWRAPLRAALDWLRDTVSVVYAQQGSLIFHDPWAAREAYIALLLDPTPDHRRQFLRRHLQAPEMLASPRMPLSLLEMQHQAMLMYTSCGWFFDELSGLESRQILWHAARVISLAQTLGSASSLEAEFLARLAEAKSNLPRYGDGRHLYEHWLRPGIPSWEQLAVEYAMRSVSASAPLPEAFYAYSVQTEDVQRLTAGEAQLWLGRVHLLAQHTQETASLWCGVLHTGDHHFYGGARLVQATDSAHPCAQAAREAFEHADTQAVIRLFHQHFGATAWPLHTLPDDAQRAILTSRLAATAADTERLYRQFYEPRLPLVHTLARLRMPLPYGLQSAATYLLHTDLCRALAATPVDLEHLKTLLDQGRQARLTLDAGLLQAAVKHSLERLASQVVAEEASLGSVQTLVAMLQLWRALPWRPDLWRVQNVCYALLQSPYPAMRQRAAQGEAQAQAWVHAFRLLAELTMVSISSDSGP